VINGFFASKFANLKGERGNFNFMGIVNHEKIRTVLAIKLSFRKYQNEMQ
jgi:hypothetical protein